MNFNGFLSGNFWLVVIFLPRLKIDKFYKIEKGNKFMILINL